MTCDSLALNVNMLISTTSATVTITRRRHAIARDLLPLTTKQQQRPGVWSSISTRGIHTIYDLLVVAAQTSSLLRIDEVDTDWTALDR